MNELRIDLDEGRTLYRPGEPIRGRAVWSLERPPEDLELRLFWFTDGIGDRDVGVVESRDLDIGMPSGEGEFEFTAPDAPLSFSSQFITLQWAIEVVANPGALAGRREFTISHLEGEIDIRADPPEEPWGGA